MIFLTQAEEYLEEMEGIAKVVSKRFRLPKKTAIEVEFVSAEEIREINREQREVDSVTDVLSFPMLDGIFGKRIRVKDYPFDIDPETGVLELGSVILCLDRAKEQAEEFGHSMRREVAYLLVHGVLHVLGYDHMTDADKQVMRTAEEEILTKLKITRI